MTDTTTEQLIGLIQEHAETSAKTANELEHLAERMAAVEGHLAAQTPLLQQLVTFEERRDRREQAAEDRAAAELLIEKERREASAEAETARVNADIAERKANLAERQTRAAWLREQGAKFIAPAVGAISVVLTGMAAYLNGWFGGHFHLGGPK